MATFGKILKDLMDEHSVDAKNLTAYLGLADSSIIYKWIKGENSMLLTTAVKIADYFQCSLDYLFGRAEEYSTASFSKCAPFDVQFKEILHAKQISQYRLLKDKVVSGGNIDDWLNKHQIPHIESIIKLADYLQVSMDYIAGREN